MTDSISFHFTADQIGDTSLSALLPDGKWHAAKAIIPQAEGMTRIEIADGFILIRTAAVAGVRILT